MNDNRLIYGDQADEENNNEEVNNQLAPYPHALAELVAACSYRPGWTVTLGYVQRGQGSEGLTLTITTKGFNAYHVDRGPSYRVHHYFPVPPAAYNARSWRRWLFEQFCLVERHEAAEFFTIDGEHPYPPYHGPGNDPYLLFEPGDDVSARTSFRGEVKEADV